jgi:phospholipase C
MLENRSFDNVFGRLYPDKKNFEGLRLTERNPWHKPDSSVEEIGVWTSSGSAAPGLPDADPGELFDDIRMQIFGLNGGPGGKPAMNGFVDNYARQPHDTPPDPKVPMHYFDSNQLPVINQLARSFGVSDCWFSSAPCETWPNRYFAHAGTAGGYVNNERSSFPYRWPRFLRTVFGRLDARGYSWKIYFHDLPQAATLIELWPKIPTRFCLFEDEFERHARAGRLPTYSFIEPRYYPSVWSQALPNDQHPPHDMRHGEALIARVYNAVRAAPTWERTLLIITYDEHGGCFDHVPPPAAVPPGGPYPDGFSFDRYGVRVPAVIVSPYVAPASIIRPAPKVRGETAYPFDHCSIQATLHKLFELGSPLTPRVAAAPDLLSALTLDAPENNGPEHIAAEAPRPSTADVRAYRKRQPNRHQAALRGPMHGLPAAVAHATARIRGLGARIGRTS